jgi:hypothetical protein
MPPLLR